MTNTKHNHRKPLENANSQDTRPATVLIVQDLLLAMCDHGISDYGSPESIAAIGLCLSICRSRITGRPFEDIIGSEQSNLDTLNWAAEFAQRTQ